MAEHAVNIEVQEMAACIQAIRKELDIIEYIVQQSLIKEVNNGDNVDKGMAGK